MARRQRRQTIFGLYSDSVQQSMMPKSPLEFLYLIVTSLGNTRIFGTSSKVKCIDSEVQCFSEALRFDQIFRLCVSS